MSPQLSAVAFSIPYFVLWKWTQADYRTPYLSEHVNTMVWMLQRHGVPIENIVCVTDDQAGINCCRTHPLWDDFADMKNVSGRQLPSCYRRLKLFDPGTQAAIGIPLGARIVSLDLDAVILQDFLSLFKHTQWQFMGWRVPGVRHRIVLNGSMWMLTAGPDLEWMWTNFARDPQKSAERALLSGYMGSDQGYISHNMLHQPKTGGWSAASDGVLSYTRDVLKLRLLPRHTRVVFFAGKQKPWDPNVRKVSNWILRYVDQPAPVAAQAVA